MKRRVFFLFICIVANALKAQVVIDQYGALIRSDTTEKKIYLCFTGHDFDEGFDHVLQVLNNHKLNASFFLTGDFVRNHRDLVKDIAKKGHFVGAHSDKHLLYCSWSKRDSLLHTPCEIKTDIVLNLEALKDLEIYPQYFMPPYEWYNQKVVEIVERSYPSEQLHIGNA